MSLQNNTPFPAMQAVLMEPEGDEVAVVVFKATYVFHRGRLTLAVRQVPIQVGPEWFGKAGSSSLRYDTELTIRKPATDVVLHATAHAPRGAFCRSIEVGFSVGALHKRLRIWGDRHWILSQTDVRTSDPLPFRTHHLAWEYAYGGNSKTGPFPWNPVGLGYAPSFAEVHGLRLPNIESIDEPIRSWRDQPQPAGFAPVDPTSEPRKQLFGTYDEKWRSKRMPLPPVDFDRRALQCAPKDQQATPHLTGRPQVLLEHLTPTGREGFRLPDVPARCTIRIGERNHKVQPVLHTVCIEPQERRLLLVWQAQQPCAGQAHRVGGARLEPRH